MTFFRHPYGIHARRHAPTRRTAAVAWFLVAFYVVASGRALLPGLCATQTAMDERCALPANGAALSVSATVCCPSQRPATGTPTDEAPVTPAESKCPFCNLLLAKTDPPLGSAAADLRGPAHVAPLPFGGQVAQEAPFAAAPNRAPPA